MNTVQRNVEAIYPLSSLQQGILYHSEIAPSSGVYIEQFIFELTGPLSHSAFQSAWSEIIKRHAVFRTLFINLDQEKPRQVVLKQVDLPWRDEDWQSLPLHTHADRMETLLTDDRKQGFTARQAPLMRVTLIRLAPQKHQFIWTHHHAIVDGWSWPIVFKDLFAIYRSISQNQPLNLPRPLPYRKYIHWLSQRDQSQAEGYWRRYLEGFNAPTTLVMDRRRENGANTLPQARQLLITDEIASAVNRLVKKEKITLNVLMQGVWALLLSRYSGEYDIVYGKVVSGRPPELEGASTTVGPFINTLPLRVKVDPEAGILPWLRQLHQSQIAQIQYHSTPLLNIQRWSGIRGGTNLFDSIFVFENYPIDSGSDALTAGTGLKIVDFYAHEQTHYPLTVQVDPSHGLTLKIIYDSALFDHSNIDRLITHFQVLLQGIANKPERKLGDLPLLTKLERERILVDWNQTQTAYSQDKCIHALFEAQVEQTPAAIALECAGKTLTYAALNNHSNQLAHYLIELGVGPDTRVGLAAGPSVERAIGVLGILKAGGAYVPLDPGYPQDRLAFMLEQATVTVLLTQQVLREQLPAHPNIVPLDDRARWQSHSTTDPVAATQPHHLAYVIYTSGSTGRPKAVAMPHRALTNLIHWQVQHSTCTTGARTLQLSAFSFDVSFQEIFATWCSGGTLVLTTEAVRQDAFALWRVIGAARINRLFMPFIALQQLAEAHHAADGHTAPNALREIITAGEQLQITPLIRALFQTLAACKLYNHYGPTETHVATAFAVTGPPATWEPLPPIGKPIANDILYILDQALQPVPVGVCGELYLGGAGLARGYLGRDDLTAERFIQNPFDDSPGARLYKTGDLARYRADGTVDYRGRMDDQVKIRGFRIEPGEIENALVELPGIKAAAVTVNSRDPAARDKYLVAYVALAEELEREREPLRQALQAILPDYMVPSVWVFLPALPLTPSGKVDRHALPAPDVGATHQYKAPRTAIEQGLVSIWADVLNLPADGVGIQDNFFDLGGHSLLATRVVSRVRKTFATEIQLRDLFTASTVQTLAAVIAEAITHSPLSDKNAFPLAPVAHRGPPPLSFAQQRLWFINQFEGGGETQYNIPWALGLHGALDIAALQQAFYTIIQRHQNLRTAFQTLDDRAAQVRVDDVPLAIPVIETPASHVPAHMAAHAAQVFTLSTGPLIRVGLLRLSAQEHVLLITMHHIIADGWSMGVLHHELSTLYTAYTQGTASPLPPLPIQYADFAHWQRQWLQGDVLAQQMAYWETQLAGAPALLELPTDRPRPATQRYQGHWVRFNLPASLTQQLHRLGRRQGATLFMTLLAGFTVLLARYSGQDDICVGTPIANRQRQELEGLIGFFVNTLVLRTQVKDSTTFIELLQQVKDTALSAYAHQDIPFEHLVEVLNPERSLSYAPLFQVLFVLQNTAQEVLELPGITASPVESDTHTAKFDLSIHLMESGEGIKGVLEYNTDLFNPTTIERLSHHYRILLEGVLSNPDQPIATLPLLGELERRQLLFEWNETSTHYPQQQCIPQLFEAQIKQRPDAVALVFNDRQLTYGALNRKSNQLAHYLIAQGVNPEVRVGLCVERSLDLVIGILGIWKAGGAYVPLDPSNPADRIQYILNDSNIAVMLTQADLLKRTLGRQTTLCIDLDRDWPEIAKRNSENPDRHIIPDNLAYVIYTSGSTGGPKGTLITHANTARLFTTTQHQYRFNQDDVWTLFHSFAFDFSVWELWGALLYGGKVIVVPYWISREPVHFGQLVRQQGVTVLNQTPSAFNQFIAADRALDPEPEKARLRYVIFGGEALDIKSLQPWFERHGDQQPQLINMYGITETTVHVTHYRLDHTTTQRPGSIIGKKLADLRAYILDEHLQMVPIGVPGELYVGGAGLARGYHNRPDLSAQRFIPDPFEPGARLYKTGDIARYLPDGEMEYQGRIDQQVKIRGFRIELGEIETALSGLPGVQETAVLIHRREQDDGSPYLAAYVVGNSLVELDQTALRNGLKASLPDYMVPSFFVFMDKMPLTSNGKTDRKALPVPDEAAVVKQGYMAPRTIVEQALVAIWAEVVDLPADVVGIQDNFFDLGGHSLLATQVVSKIRKHFNIEIQIRDLFIADTIQTLALIIDQEVTDRQIMDSLTSTAAPTDTTDRDEVMI